MIYFVLIDSGAAVLLMMIHNHLNLQNHVVMMLLFFLSGADGACEQLLWSAMRRT